MQNPKSLYGGTLREFDSQEYPVDGALSKSASRIEKQSQSEFLNSQKRKGRLPTESPDPLTNSEVSPSIVGFGQRSQLPYVYETSENLSEIRKQSRSAARI